MYFSDKILKFYDELEIKERLPEDIKVMNPFKNHETKKVCREFYSKYYKDQKNRRIILGINPGRFGAGITGIPFTDPIRMEENCGIPNNFEKKPELSSIFVYSLIDHMGGPAQFFKHYYIGAVSPLGFIKDNKNFNYYDHKLLERSLKPFIVRTLIQQIALGIDTQKCFCLGQGKNFEYMEMLNIELKVFKEIVPLPHPRWIMQYRRPQMENYLDDIRKLLSV
ncbi:MAG: DUF4918 family protein [Bacteroidales bacterium]|nr:DUF4918 family protein [Bacteroidales bacterium]